MIGWLLIVELYAGVVVPIPHSVSFQFFKEKGLCELIATAIRENTKAAITTKCVEFKK